VDEACHAIVRVTARIAPQPTDKTTMQNAYRRYRRIYPALHSIAKASN